MWALMFFCPFTRFSLSLLDLFCGHILRREFHIPCRSRERKPHVRFDVVLGKLIAFQIEHAQESSGVTSAPAIRYLLGRLSIPDACGSDVPWDTFTLFIRLAD